MHLKAGTGIGDTDIGWEGKGWDPVFGKLAAAPFLPKMARHLTSVAYGPFSSCFCSKGHHHTLWGRVRALGDG